MELTLVSLSWLILALRYGHGASITLWLDTNIAILWWCPHRWLNAGIFVIDVAYGWLDHCQLYEQLTVHYGPLCSPRYQIVFF